MNPQSSIGVAVLGAGHWGRNLIRNFHALGALRAVCDIDPRLGADVEQAYPGVAFVDDPARLDAVPGIDAVALASPAVHHAAQARRFLAAGKHVYVEKPLALTVPDGEAVVAEAARAGRVLMVGHLLRYHPAVEALSGLIEAGALGQIRYAYSNRLNIGRIRTEENILWSFAPHDISVLLHLLGEEPSEVRCSGSSHLNADVADVTLSDLSFPSGVRAHIFVSWLHPFKEQRLVVVGSEKMAVFDDNAAHKLVLYPHRVEWKERRPVAVRGEGEPVAIDPEEPLRRECRHFLDCAASGKAPLTDGAEGLRVLRILRACQESLEQGGRPLAVGAATPGYRVHPTAIVEDGAAVGAGTAIWHHAHVMKGARVGARCSLGQNVHVADGAVIGNGVKIQNNISVYSGVTLEDDVFLGPACVLTNVSNPRSQVSRRALYEKTLVRRGASIGANATVVCGITVGRYAFVGAGAVVTRDVPDYALVLGNPGRVAGWMSRHGHRLGVPDAEGVTRCPESGYRYREVEPGVLRCLDLDEDAPLPAALASGSKSYREFPRGRGERP